MNKWKGSFGAKAGAWVGITLSAVIFLSGIAGVMLMLDAGVYDTPRQEFHSEAYESIANQYAIRALEALQTGKKYGMDSPYFRYGIVKAEEIEGLDLSDESIYVEKNFTEIPKLEDLALFHYRVGENTKFDYSLTLFGGYALYDENAVNESTETIQLICYNLSNGIFYYETEAGYFPVKNVRIGRETGGAMSLYEFLYDANTNAYLNKGKLDADNVQESGEPAAADTAGNDMNSAVSKTGASDTSVMEEAPTARVMTDADEVLQMEYLTLDLFDYTQWSYKDWSYLVLDGITVNNHDRLMLVDDAYMKQEDVSTEEDYSVDTDNYTLSIRQNAAGEGDSYWVVVELPQSVATGWSEDLFVQANTLTKFMYNLRYGAFAIIAAAFGLGIFFFAFLLRAAGHRRGTDEITAGAIDTMPFDIYLCFAFVGEMLLFYTFLDLRYHVDNIAVILILCCLILSGGWLLLLSFLTFAVRIKLGKWWKNTVIYFVFDMFYKLIRFIAANISVMWKSIGLFAAVTFLEFLFMAYTISYGGGPLMLLLGIEALQLAAICFGVVQAQRLKIGGQKLADGDMEHRIDTERMYWEFKQHGENLNSIRAGMSKAVDERMKSERFKTELITNVSHDIKTPLTSIINYVDLLEKEELNNEKAEEYLEVLQRQSARLKKLIEDLMEASKASTGNLTVNFETLEAGVSVVQIVGEFEERMKANDLELLIKKPDSPVCVMADSRHFWRVIDNLMNNICKYAQPSTRVYINLEENESSALLTFRNTSRYPLNISSEELMERFVRGDSSRNTEGSGLGISIAKSLMELMNGSLELNIDGDLFKVILIFNKIKK